MNCPDTQITPTGRPQGAAPYDAGQSAVAWGGRTGDRPVAPTIVRPKFRAIRDSETRLPHGKHGLRR